MAEEVYNSLYTGEEVDTAVGKALSPDTTPTTGSNELVTSGGVRRAINEHIIANEDVGSYVGDLESLTVGGITGNTYFLPQRVTPNPAGTATTVLTKLGFGTGDSTHIYSINGGGTDVEINVNKGVDKGKLKSITLGGNEGDRYTVDPVEANVNKGTNRGNLTSITIGGDDGDKYTVPVVEANPGHWTQWLQTIRIGNGYYYIDPDNPCVIEGTTITMYDGTKKRVEDVVEGDQILSYDFITKEFVPATCIMCRGHSVNYEFYETVYYDGENATNLIIKEPHEIYSVTQDNVRPIRDEFFPIGDDVYFNDNKELKTKTYIVKRAYYPSKPLRPFTIVSSNNVYFANDIMNCQTTLKYIDKYIRSKYEEAILKSEENYNLITSIAYAESCKNTDLNHIYNSVKNSVKNGLKYTENKCFIFDRGEIFKHMNHFDSGINELYIKASRGDDNGE